MQADEALVKSLRRKARGLFGLEGGEDEEDDDSDDEFTDDEEAQSPLDSLDPYVVFADTLAGLHTAAPARHAALMAGCDAGVQQALAGMAAYAEQQRHAAAAKAAA